MCIQQVLVLSLLCFTLTCNGQTEQTSKKDQSIENLHHGLTERIGNFSLELLYHTAQVQDKSRNLIMSPVTVWTVLAVIAEGAVGSTLGQICRAIRISPRELAGVRREFQQIAQWLQVNTTTVELQKFNALFVDSARQPYRDFSDTAKEYDTRLVVANFSDSEGTANVINSAISNVTRGHIKSIVNSLDLVESAMVLTSALYFKGQWTAPFNKSETTVAPFYDSNGDLLGEVNMMYNRYNYPWANIKALNARILEVPYGKENRLSMLIMLPNPGVSVEDMFVKFSSVPLDTVFKEIKMAAEMYGEEEADVYLPRFRIRSNLKLTDPLNRLGIYDLFDANYAKLSKIARTLLHVTRVLHKAEIEVTEEGTTATGATTAEFGNRIGNNRFEVNRPFVYLIIEKTTNTIVFGGFYRQPTLY